MPEQKNHRNLPLMREVLVQDIFSCQQEHYRVLSEKLRFFEKYSSTSLGYYSQLGKINDSLQTLKVKEIILTGQLREYDAYHPSAIQILTRIPVLIRKHQIDSKRYGLWHKIPQIFIIVFSVLVVALSAGEVISGRSIMTIVLNVLISIMTGLVLFFRPKEKYLLAQETANKISYEYECYRYRIGSHQGLAEEASLSLLAESVLAIQENQRKTQLQLEQSGTPDPKQKTDS